MPHFTFEYSANLGDTLDIKALCDETLAAALATGAFETGAVRVRAIRCDHYAIADRLPENAFVDLTLKIGPGRPDTTKRQIGDAVFAAVSGFCAPLFDTPHFALSFQIREIDGEFSWKKNAMHARLRGGERA